MKPPIVTEEIIQMLESGQLEVVIKGDVWRNCEEMMDDDAPMDRHEQLIWWAGKRGLICVYDSKEDVFKLTKRAAPPAEMSLVIDEV